FSIMASLRRAGQMSRSTCPVLPRRPLLASSLFPPGRGGFLARGRQRRFRRFGWAGRPGRDGRGRVLSSLGIRVGRCGRRLTGRDDDEIPGTAVTGDGTAVPEAIVVILERL